MYRNLVLAKYLLLSCLVLSCALSSCMCDMQGPPPAVPDGPVSWSYIAVGQQGSEVRARGFDQALPLGTSVDILVDGSSVATAEADDRGRFDVTFSADNSVELVVTGGELEQEERLVFAVHDMQQSRETAVNQRLAQTGAVPNHIAMAPGLAADGDAALLIVSSGDNLVDNISMTTGTRLFPAVLLPERAGPTGSLTAQPFAVQPFGSAAAVSCPGQLGVSVFDISNGTILYDHMERQARPLPQAFTPVAPVDGNGDGSPETPITSLLPRTQEGLAVVGDKLFVCAANFFTNGPPVVYGPGMVLVYQMGNSLAPANPAALYTTFQNPQTLAVGNGQLIVAQTGVLSMDGGWHAQTEGGLDIYDLANLSHVRSINLGHTGVGPIAVSPDGTTAYVGSQLEAVVFAVDLESGDSQRIELFESGSVQSVFSLQMHPMGLLFATSFNSDQVYIVDTASNKVGPWPFDTAFRVGEGGMAFAGAHALALRNGRNGVDYQGPDFAVLMSLAARVAAIDTRWMMGP